MKIRRARTLAAIAVWLLLLAPLLLDAGGTFASAVLTIGLSAVFSYLAWRVVNSLLVRIRLGRRRTLKTQGTISDRHLERVYDSGGTLVRWVTRVNFATGTKRKGRIDWAPYDAFTNSEGTIDRVDRQNPVGKKLWVYVDPDDPENASVGKRMSFLLYPALAVGALGLMLSLVAFVTSALLFVAASMQELLNWLS